MLIYNIYKGRAFFLCFLKNSIIFLIYFNKKIFIIINLLMKHRLQKILVILFFIQVKLAYQNKDSSPFKTGEIELFASFDGVDRQQRSFVITSDHRPGDQLAINLLDLNINSDGLQNSLSVTGWQVQIKGQYNQGVLEIAHKQSYRQQKSSWIIKISFILIRRQFSKVFFIQNLQLIDNVPIYNLENNMILTISPNADTYQQKSNSYEMVILHRGLQMKKDKNPISLGQINLKGYFINQAHIHIQTNISDIKFYFITLIIINPSQFYPSFRIIHFPSYPKIEKELSFILPEKMSFQKCKSALTSNQPQAYCLSMRSQQQIVQFQRVQLIKVQQQMHNMIKTSNFQNQEQFFSNQNRLLHNGCDYEEDDLSTCDCDEANPIIPYARLCYQDYACQCKVHRCAKGYYAIGILASSCTKCPPSLKNCEDCELPLASTKPICTSCFDGFTAVSGACTSCPSGCSTCMTTSSSQISCTGCLATLTLQSSGSLKICGCPSNQIKDANANPVVCIGCPNICKTCTSSTACTSCISGYYLSVSSCLTCMPVCKNCSTSSTCSGCLSSTFSLVSGVCTCPSTLFFDNTTKSCRSCSQLQDNCLTCNYSLTFDPANPPVVICTAASSGYYLSSGLSNACIDYCLNCDSNSSICDVPEANFIFDVTGCVCDYNLSLYFSNTSGTCMTCQQVVPGCVSCQNTTIPNPTQCTLCNITGFYNTTDYPTTSCTPCPVLCTSCTNANNCTSCINNLTVLPSGQCGCYENISLFIHPISKVCISCSQIIFNCQTCNFNTSSVTCATCLPGNYPSSAGLDCYPCPTTCSNCQNSTFCTGCQLGYQLISNQCECGTNCTDCMSNSSNSCASCIYNTSFTCLSCAVGFVSNSSSCVSCTTNWTLCSQCTVTGCLACQSPFVLVFPSNCVCNNTAGLYLKINSSTCLPCSSAIPQCTNCSNTGSTTCLQCATGYFVSSSQICSLCTDNCLTCSTSSNHCDSCLLTYSMLSNNTCGCNNTGGYFYDSSTSGCSPCSILIPNCISCMLNLTNQTQCTQCSSTYYWNSTTFSCEPCSSTCNNCSSYSYCTSCLYNLVPVSGLCVCNNATPTVYLDLTSGTCQECSFIISGCGSCSSNNSVVQCISCASSTYLVNNTCANCPLTCATCDSTGCLSCPANMTLSNKACICSSLCKQCNLLSTGCLSCLISSSVITACYSCSPGTYLATPNCIPCPSSCKTCSSQFICLTCQQTYVLINGMCQCAVSVGIFPNATGICADCSQIYYACIQCEISGGVTVCNTCQEGYYSNGTSCLPCNTNCKTCSSSATTCSSCPTGQTLSGGICSCLSNDCLACSLVSPNCTQCAYTIYGNYSYCKTCQSGYYKNGINCSPCPSICKLCGENGTCTSCGATYEVINSTCLCNQDQSMFQSGNLCVTCNYLFSNCQTCTKNLSSASNVSCSQCINSYYLNNSVCVASVCGNGVITNGQSCDDKNTKNGDGCSSFCQIQTNFQCVGQPSVCIVNVNFTIKPTTIEVSATTCNEVTVAFELWPIYEAYDSADFKNMFGSVSLDKIIYKSFSYSKGIVKYTYSYTSTLSDVTTTFYFTPSALSIDETSSLPIIAVKVKLTPTNNILLIFYEEEVCQSKASIQAIAAVIEYASYGTLLFSAVPSKIVGLELFGVLQLAHINIGNMDNVNTMMTPLMGMKGVHGFTIDLGQEQAASNSSSRLLQDTPARVQSIGYQSNFLRNCNVMLFIVVSIILVSLILYILTYFCKKCAPSLHSISKRIVKEVLLTLILFNCYNFAYSAGIHFNYASKQDSLYTAGTIAAVISLLLPIIMALGLMCSQDQGFGEYKDKFKPGVVERLYFVVTIIYRTGIGLYISTMNEDQMSTLIVMALSIAFLLYNLVNLPYAKAYHNYRANICHLTQFISLFVAMYYRSMKSTSSRNNVSTIFSPAYIQLSFICLSLVISMVVLVYEIYLFIKDCCRKKRIRKRKVQSDSSIQVSKINNHHVHNTEEDINCKDFQVEDIE